MLQLSKHNAQIYMAARNESKAETAIANIKKEVPRANITFLELDLASLESVKKAADTFNASSERLDILMNNAGVMAHPADTTKEGYEIQFGTNHVGHALFTKLLLPKLLKTAVEPASDVRIINLSSLGHQMPPKGGLVLKEVCSPMASYSTWTRYGQSKLANILFTRDLAGRYPSIKSIAVHPGNVRTGLQDAFTQSHPWLTYPITFMKAITTISVKQGALNQLWAATSKDAQSGQYYVPVAKESAGSSYAQSKALQEELSQWTEKELIKQGY